MAFLFHPSSSSIRWTWISLVGPDAQDFLQRLTTVDARNLEVGHGSPGCFLTAQGKLVSIFHLWRYGKDEFAFELDAGSDGHWKKALLEIIDRYTFAEKMTLTPVEGLDCAWILSEPEGEAKLLESIGAPALRAGETLAIDEEIRISHHGSRDFGRAWLTVWGRPARLAQWLERALPAALPINEKEIERLRILSVRPWPGHELDEQTIPLEAGLVDAIAPQKGCYPGQEVVERILSMGSPPRRLSRIEGTGVPPEQGEPILNTAEKPAEVGRVTSVVQVGARFFVLGYLRKIHAKEGLSVRFGSGVEGTVAQIAPYSAEA